jgi:hypothetical protein
MPVWLLTLSVISLLVAVAIALWIAVAKDTLHCGSGCTLGEPLAFLLPAILVPLSWPGVFPEPDVSSPVFWFTMQFAMIAGFITACPMNWWLIRMGIKERM